MLYLLKAEWGKNVAFFRTEEELDEFVALNNLEGVECELNWVLL